MTETEDIQQEIANREMPVTICKPKKRLMLFGNEFVYIYVLAIAASFIGWVVENIARLVGAGILDCRFHILPFISPYGLAVFAMYIAIGDTDSMAFFNKKIFKKDTKKTKILSNLLSFAIICAFVFFGELVFGNLMEACFGVKLWNYSAHPLHVTQYASLFTTLGFGAGAWFIMKFCFYPALRFLQRKMNYKAAVILVLTLGIAIVADTCGMVLQVIITGNAPMYWSIKVW